MVKEIKSTDSTVDTDGATALTARPLKARELLRLPREQRDAILEAAAALAAAEYRTDPELTMVTKSLEGEEFAEC